VKGRFLLSPEISLFLAPEYWKWKKLLESVPSCPPQHKAGEIKVVTQCGGICALERQNVLSEVLLIQRALGKFPWWIGGVGEFEQILA
jgi:hypothetical protein